MGVRARIGQGLEATLGNERTSRVRRLERRTREQLADKLAPRPVERSRAAGSEGPVAVRKPGPGVPGLKLGEPNDRQGGGWRPSDPFVPHPQPTTTRHDLLRGLHRVLTPRTYLEIGVNEGSSLTLSRAKSIGVDPDFVVRQPLRCDLALVKAKGDEFFTRPGPTGIAIVGGGDPSSNVLRQGYPSQVAYLEAPDPQRPPQEYMSRSVAVDPADLLASQAWPLLVAARQGGDSALVVRAQEILRSIPTLG